MWVRFFFTIKRNANPHRHRNRPEAFIYVKCTSVKRREGGGGWRGGADMRIAHVWALLCGLSLCKQFAKSDMSATCNVHFHYMDVVLMNVFSIYCVYMYIIYKYYIEYVIKKYIFVNGLKCVLSNQSALDFCDSDRCETRHRRQIVICCWINRSAPGVIAVCMCTLPDTYVGPSDHTFM